jgi:hypothetical protein
MTGKGQARQPARVARGGSAQTFAVPRDGESGSCGELMHEKSPLICQFTDLILMPRGDEACHSLTQPASKGAGGSCWAIILGSLALCCSGTAH